MISLDVDDRRVMARLDAMPSGVRAALLKKVTVLRLKLEARIKQKLSGEVLNVRTGNLRRSIFSETINDGARVEGRAASSGDVKYGAIHEFGGVIVPVKAKTLSFVIDGKRIFTKKVVMPKRSFMRTSLSELKPEIIAGLQSAVGEAVNR